MWEGEDNARPRAPTDPSPRRLEHRPHIDGLRALAVAAVVAFHLDRLPGGNLGVDAFFVISGWIVTSALLVTVPGSGPRRLDLASFWSARVRRLLPASALTLLAVTVVWSALAINAPTLRRDVAFALGWASNWGTITSGGDYWARFGEASPVAHFWSLAVEEQFYLAWPLVLWVIIRTGGRARAVLATTVLLASASVAAMVALFDPADPSGTYLHTGARAHSLLIGAAAAAVSILAKDRPWISRATSAAVLPASAVAVGILLLSDKTSTWLYRGGFPVFAVAMAVVVMWLAERPDRGVLRHPALRWVGDRSYGIYLWHWPVILLLAPPRARLDGVLRDVVCVAAAVGLAAMSHRFLEQPVRRSPRVTWRWAPGFALGTLGACLLVLGAASPPRTPELAVASVVTLPPEPSTSDGGAVSLTGGARMLPSVDEISKQARATPAARAIPATSASPIRVLVAGDSTGVQLARELIAQTGAPGSPLAVASAAYAGCGLSVGHDGRQHESTAADGSSQLNDLSACIKQWSTLPDRIRAEGIDVVLVQIGAWDGVDIHLADGEVVSVVTDRGRDLVATAYRDFASAAEAAGARLAWVLPPDLKLGWGRLDTVLDDPDRWRSLREVIRTLPGLKIDLGRWLHEQGLEGEAARPDGVHLSPEAETRFVAEVVVPALVARTTTEPQAG